MPQPLPKAPSNPPQEKGMIRVAEGLFRYSCGGTFYAMFNHNGKRIRQRLGTKEIPCTSLPEAKRLLLDLKVSLANTNVLAGKKPLKVMLAEYVTSLTFSKNTRAYKIAILEKFVSSFPGSKRIGEVKKSDVLKYLATTSSPSSHNHALTAIRAFFEYAIADGATGISPTSKITYRRNKGEVKRLIPSKEEFEAIVHSIRDVVFSDTATPSADLVEFMGLAGLGQAECDGLLWDHINFQSGVITIIRKKTGQQFAIPIYPQLLPLLTRMKSEATGKKVFGVKNPKKSLESACARLGLPDYSPRAFRRMFITRCLELGIDPQTIAEWQGHRDGGQLILKVYGRVSKAHQTRMANLLAPDQSKDAPTDKKIIPMPQSACG